jgi:hypothetical protein
MLFSAAHPRPAAGTSLRRVAVASAPLAEDSLLLDLILELAEAWLERVLERLELDRLVGDRDEGAALLAGEAGALALWGGGPRRAVVEARVSTGAR